jgi:hypothetical protein
MAGVITQEMSFSLPQDALVAKGRESRQRASLVMVEADQTIASGPPKCPSLAEVSLPTHHYCVVMDFFCRPKTPHKYRSLPGNLPLFSRRFNKLDHP